ncbi:hypothetical protein SMMN14_09502 [Sphaerulina musiva]
MSRPFNLLVTSIVTVIAIFIGLQFHSPDSLLMRFITPYSASILPQARRAFAPIASTFSTFPPTMSSSTSNRDAENAVDGQPLGLPPPPSEEEAAMKLDMSSGSDTIKLDHLGPLVVNKDGSLSRISNWEQMTAQEKKSTLKILGKRNQLRTDALKESEDTIV